MPDLIFDPPIPQRPAQRQIEPLVQRIDLREKTRVIGTARWHATAGVEGVAQVLDLTIIPEQRRRGNGSTLLNAVIAQAVAAGKARGVPVRRIWMSLEQKTQIQARAFLTRNGFHHVATITELLSHQDALVYMRSLD